MSTCSASIPLQYLLDSFCNGTEAVSIFPSSTNRRSCSRWWSWRRSTPRSNPCPPQGPGSGSGIGELGLCWHCQAWTICLQQYSLICSVHMKISWKKLSQCWKIKTYFTTLLCVALDCGIDKLPPVLVQFWLHNISKSISPKFWPLFNLESFPNYYQ